MWQQELCQALLLPCLLQRQFINIKKLIRFPQLFPHSPLLWRLKDTCLQDFAAALCSKGSVLVCPIPVVCVLLSAPG